MSPKVSIIIPTFNRADLLRQTLASVQQQTFQDWECIVVDDGSTDNNEQVTLEFSDQDARFRFLTRPDNLAKGANSCRNFGFSQSKGEFVNWFDSDDVMLPGFLKAKLDAVRNGIDLVICTGWYASENLEQGAAIPIDIEGNLFSDYVMWKAMILTPSVLFRRSFLSSRELFLSRMSRGQEAEFFSRIFYELNQAQVAIVPEKLFLYRQHEQSKTFRNTKYVPGYKESFLYFLTQNLDRGLVLRDEGLIRFIYERLVILYLEGIQNKHTSNVSEIAALILRLLRDHNRLMSYEFRMWHVLLNLRGRDSYVIGKRIRNYNLKFDRTQNDHHDKS